MICTANHLTGFYMMVTQTFNGLKNVLKDQAIFAWSYIENMILQILRLQSSESLLC